MRVIGEWVLQHIEWIMATTIAPLLMYWRDKAKFKKDLEKQTVDIESSKYESMQKQIGVFESLLSNYQQHSEKMQKIYQDDIERLKSKLDEMNAEHKRERAANMKQIEILNDEIKKLKLQLDEALKK